ncbi:WavE lipopolysaccharide synthesis OS=Flavobacterium johnsoniae (strain ATCC 17061 / DSM 2064 / UW101) GN=Fjoh_0346 PE=4 SV=1: WavE [Gemmataceae bacterium]|nr:WavE lipopolysaccharide synthesis OS=Flavobacterium johnsoniae (strain ATCC 17061 / DSM 2064 / UW101) GN=Fjoh_0346 PE=4 SV=1: WavE [Gemmataceae bacterium]VTU00943.1 WavE lipopolysaccharide synthesis OS=Flavobacterium johnsoniae (strain ATCC 17061 / DSM 2064 / UW101) GN=Fjoh_0346 PE=4 SV=1: WavE [Gemmataceae bacterium]
MISPSDISVVVQGPIAGGPGDPPATRLTARCLESVHTHLPGAEVILSTWDGSDLSGLEPDVAVTSPDPGGVSVWSAGHWVYNLNRQIRTTVAGLRRATRRYAIKIRTDMVVEHTGFLALSERFPARHPDWRVFDRRVVCCTLISLNPRRFGLVLHPSDWFHFGTTADVLRLWDVPEDEGHRSARYFDDHPRPVPDKNPGYSCRYAAEQYVWLHCLAKHAPHGCEHLWHATPETVRLTELTFANNLILADEDRVGVRFCKYRQPRHYTLSSYSHAEWVGLYRRYCDPAHPAVGWPGWSAAARYAELFARKAVARVSSRFARKERP